MASKITYTPEQLKTLVDALNVAPTYLSRRFILKYLCNWSDDMIAENMRLRQEEDQQSRMGDKTWLR